MNIIRLIAVIVALAAALWLLAARDPAAETPSETPGGPLSPVVKPVLEAHARRNSGLPYHGLAIQIHSADDAARRYGALIDEIADLGADTVMISLNGYQEHVDSVQIYHDPEATPSDEAIEDLIDRAHRRGLRVILMPKVLLSDPRNGAWRGQIKPPSWTSWFDQYRDFLLPYAKLAEEADVEVFILGSELVSTEKFTEQWERTIREVRNAYSGQIAYSANWDHYTSIQFWNKLDLLGMTTYYKLSKEPGPSLPHLLERWAEIKRDILSFQARVQKPILFTEAGWCSQEGCSVEAWNYYRDTKTTPAALEEQRRNFQAFLETWSEEPALGGIIWWEWTEGPGGVEDYGYSPKGKPAEKVLRRFFRQRGK